MVCLGYMLGMKTSHLYGDYHKPAKSASLPRAAWSFYVPRNSRHRAPSWVLMGKFDQAWWWQYLGGLVGWLVGWLVGGQKTQKYWLVTLPPIIMVQ